ncbi:MAG: MATE family efflux transporter [Deltaproteobacteria bacterium]|nr:MATE family efflux transporter [Deltaproteobacteria bacterium]
MSAAESKIGAPSVNIEKITEAELPKAVITLAWPVVLEMTFFGLGIVINTILVGRLGASSLAAVGLAQQVEFMMHVIFAAVGVGATAIVARHIGAAEIDDANNAVNQAFILAVFAGLAFMFPVWIFAREAMIMLQAQPDVVVLGVQYIHAITFSFIPGYILFSGNAVIRGAGNTRTPMIIMMIVTIANVIFGYLLIYGGLGFPALGVTGAGLATAISRTIGAVAVLFILLRGAGPLKYHLSRSYIIDFVMMKRILKVGLPAGLEQLQFQMAITLYTIIISSLGTTVIAAHAVALRIENIAFMPGFGFGVASMTLVGQFLGAQRPELAELSAHLSQKYAMMIMTFIGIVLFFLGRYIAAVFISDPEVIGLAVVSLRIWAFGMTMMGKSNTLAGGLRGAGDTRWVLIIMASCSWFLRIPIALLLAKVLNIGAAGAWIAAITDVNARGFFIWRRFKSGKWKTLQV